ncbi:MAG: sulfatase-like hydrolase/transferase [Marivita sp.]|uniref:sulfatase-like hydrolase/transferase n=1 Tax=Marivita sp. TaxID=2003365 RepID=UPI0025B8DF5D|nr:sulfatase-like hydrolase/transferase [Marivita sp.]MCI5110496.1 sulfatase-like hydrolase/transferase [Marivita sp.]
MIGPILGSAVSKSKPNTLFIVIDQLRADCVFGALAEHLDMPNIRSLAEDAVSFRNHYSVTSPCGPSRVSLLTAQYASNHGARRNGTPLKRDVPNLATVTRQHGFDPLLFGYTDTSQDPRFLPPDDPRLFSYEELAPGFQEVVRMRLEGDSRAWEEHLRAAGYDVPPYPEMYRPVGDTPDSPAMYAAEHSDTAFLTDQVIAGLGQRPPGWFGLVTYIRPHPPFVAPAPYNQMYDETHLPSAKEAAEPGWHPFVTTARRKANVASTVVGFPELEASDATTRMIRKLYFGLATEVDHHVGRLIAWLKDSGQYDDTLIVLTADHGEMLGDYGLGGKTTFHDAAFHVPLIIRHPHTTVRGITVTEPTESIDVTPTILDCLGLDIPHSMDGRSLVPFLNGTTPEDWRTVSVSELDFGDPLAPTLWQRDHGISIDAANLSVMRKDSLRFVQFAGGLPPILMDVSDGLEDQNLTKNSAYAQTMLDLMQLMLCHRMVNTDGTFSRTMITDDGVKVAS